MNKMNKKGFTLIEMLVVIAIIAVLVSIIVPVVGNSTTKAKAAADAANLRSIAASVAVDFLDNEKLDNTYENLPGEGKVTGANDAAKYLSVWLIDNEIVAFYGDHGVDYYSQIAEGVAADDIDTDALLTKPSREDDTHKTMLTGSDEGISIDADFAAPAED